MNFDDFDFKKAWRELRHEGKDERIVALNSLVAQLGISAVLSADYVMTRTLADLALKGAEEDLAKTAERGPATQGKSEAELAAWHKRVGDCLAAVRHRVLLQQVPWLKRNAEDQLDRELRKVIAKGINDTLKNASEVAIRELWMLSQLEKVESFIPPAPEQEQNINVEQAVTGAWDSLHLHSKSWSREVESPRDQAAEAAVAMARASLRMAERSLTASVASTSEDTPEGEAAAQRLAQLRAELINSDGLGVPELATLGAERTAQLRHLVALCNAFFPALENAVEQYAQLVAESPETLLEADQQ